MKYFLFLFSLITLNYNGVAQTVPLEKIDALFEDWQEGEQPGGSLGIYQNGKIIKAKGYGYANMDYAIPNKPNSVFRIASTSKQFTAACVVLLAEQGKLKLEDSIRKYFPAFPEYADDINILHLIHHNSGVRDYLELSYLAGLGNNDFYTDEEVKRWLINQKELNFSPGEEHLYSNSGYWLLGQLVEKVSGKNMAEYAQENIFEPLGMTNTHFHNNAQAIVKNRAYGYRPVDDGFEVSMTPLDMIGDGGIFTTVEDFKKWDDEFYNQTTLNANFWKVMTTVGILNNGEETGYAGGLGIDEFNGQHLISHGGAFVGYRAQFYRFPEHHLTIVLFCNRSDGNPFQKVRAIAELIFAPEEADEQTAKTVEAKPIALSNGDAYVGKYVEDPGVSFSVALKADTLFVTQSWNQSQYPILPTDQGTFIIEGTSSAHFTFTEMAEGAYSNMVLHQGSREIIFAKGVEFDDSTLNLEDYTGEFYSSELNCHYQIFVKNKKLNFTVNNTGDAMEMLASSPTLFTGGGRTIDFKNKAEGAPAKGFSVDGGRVKGVAFSRR